MKMARASERDFAAIDELHIALQCFCDPYSPRFPDKGDEEGAPIPDDEVPDELGRFMQEWWERNEGSWNRVTFGAKIVIEAACDPALPHLEWKPEYKAAIEAIDAEKKAGGC